MTIKPLNAPMQTSNTKTSLKSQESIEKLVFSKDRQVEKKELELTGDDVFGYAEFGFVGADKKLLESFDSLTNGLDALQTNALSSDIDFVLVNYHKDRIISELKSILGDNVEIDSKLNQKIFSEAQKRTQEEGFLSVNITDFLHFGRKVNNDSVELFTHLENLYIA